jgi:predicted MFS family arabinose efflux permease
MPSPDAMPNPTPRRRRLRLPDRWRPAADDLLQDRTYRRLWTSILISSLGGQITLLALPLTAAVLLHATPRQMGYLTAMELVPYVLLGLPAGVWLDRRRKLPVYVFGEFAMALAVLSVPIAWWLGDLGLPWLYVVGFGLGAINSIAGSAAQIVLTQVVPRERLVEAHAKNAMATSAAEVVGPGVAGVIIKAAGPPIALIADALLLVSSSLILRGIRIDEPGSASPARFTTALREGLDFVRHHALLVAMAAMVGLWQFCNQGATVVHILFATRELGLSARTVGLCYVASGCGTIVASAVGHRVARRLGSGPTMVLGIGISGAGWLLLAAAPANLLGTLAYTLMLFCFGFGAVLLFITFLALRQSVTPPRLLGRMTTTMRWLTLVPSVPGALWAGWLGQHVGLRAALCSSGVLALLVAIAGLRIRAVRETTALPGVAGEAVTPYASADAT